MHDTTHSPRAPKRNTRPGAVPPPADWRAQRPGEQIGGGYIVVRRGRHSHRLRLPEFPFEHPSCEAALTECARLSRAHPNQHFEVWARVAELAP